MSKKAIPDFIAFMNSMSSTFDSENDEHFKEFIQKDETLSTISNVGQFNSEITAKFKHFTIAYVNLEVAKGNSNLVFLYSNYNFVYNQFVSLFERIEGMAYSTDKTTTVLNALERYFVSGDEIEFDFYLKVKYFLPEKIFVNHESIMEFYNSLIHLYYGSNVKYLLAIKGIYNSVQTNKKD
jgi:hypothetical protein